MTRHSTAYRVVLSGDMERAGLLAGMASTQMGILKNLMAKQGLDQYQRVLALSDGSEIFCSSVFGTDTVRIFSPPIEETEEEIPIEIIEVKDLPLLLCCGNSERVLTFSYGEDSPPFESGNELLIGGLSAGTIRDVQGNRLYGSFSNYDAGDLITSAGAFGSISSCLKLHYAHKYRVENIRSAFGLNLITAPDGIYGPVDYPPASDMPCEFPAAYAKSWSKTYGPVTLTAALDETVPILTLWYVAATVNGRKVKINGADTWGGYVRGSVGGASFIGFDVWEEEGAYLISTCSNLGRRIEVFRFENDNFVRIESHQAVSAEPWFNNDNVLLCGHAKREAWYFWPGTNWLFHQNYDAVVTVTANDDDAGGRYLDAIWNHANDQLYTIWKAYPFETEGDPRCYSTGSLGRTYYSSLYCTKYANGAFDGEKCASKAFVGVPDSVTYQPVWWCNSIDLMFYRAVNETNRFTWTTHYLILELSNIERVLGEFRFGGTPMDMGLLRFSTGTFRIVNINASGSVQNSGSRYIEGHCHPEEAWDVIYDGDAIFDAAGGIAGITYKAEYNNDREMSELESECILGEYSQTAAGDPDLVAISGGGFPHDANWRAVLKAGNDCAGDEVTAPAVLYNGFVKTADGRKIFHDDYNAVRGMFIRYPLAVECPEN
jgi:hypothetical protein